MRVPGVVLWGMMSVLLASCGGAAAPPSTASTSPAAAAASTKPAASTPASASAPASAKPAASASGGTRAVPPISGPPAPAGAIKLTAFYSTISATFTVMWLAKEAGLFQKNGLDVDVEYIQNPQGTAAMLANQVQLGLSGAADMLGPDSSGADLTAYATFTKTYPYTLEVAQNIKTTDDLKGRKIGASQAGGSDYVALLAVLNKLGLDPTKDLSILFVGGLTQRTAAVLGGNVVGTLTSPPETLTLEKNGFHPLLDVTSLNLPSATSTLTAHKAWVQANKATMQKFVDSLMQSIALEKSDKAQAERVMGKYLKLDDQAVLDATYDFFALKLVPEVPHVSAAQFKDTADSLSKTSAAIKNVDLNSIVDDSFVRDAASRGLGGKS